MKNNTDIMFGVIWFTDDKGTFIEKCLVGSENLHQLSDPNSTCNKDKQTYRNDPE